MTFLSKLYIVKEIIKKITHWNHVTPKLNLTTVLHLSSIHFKAVSGTCVDINKLIHKVNKIHLHFRA